jgi:hypothetical protein
MAGLLIVLFIAVVFVGCAAETALLVATGNWRWDDYISRTSKQLWSGGYLLALVLAIVFFGPAAVLSAWPLWLALPAGTFAVFGGLDLAFGVRRPQPRVIQHADGRQAIVDAATGKGYQRLPEPSPVPRPPSLLDRWLNEKV